MKKRFWWALLFISVCCLSGCIKSEPLVQEEDKEILLTEKTPFPTLAVDWSNWVDGIPASCGGGINLWDKEDVLINEMTIMTGDIVEAKVGYRLDVDEYKEYGEAHTITIVTVNDTVCEFQLNGQQSERGVLSTKKVINQDKKESLLITDCNLREGENELAVHMAIYFPQVGHTITMSISRQFQAEKSHVQSAMGLCGSEDELGFTVTTCEEMDEKDVKKELSKGNIFFYKQISFDPMKWCTTVPWDGEMGFEFRNTGGSEGVTPVEREVLILVLKNGELIPIQGNKSVYLCMLSEQELCKKIPFELKGVPGEYAHMTFVCFDLNKDGSTSCNERLFYFQ